MEYLCNIYIHHIICSIQLQNFKEAHIQRLHKFSSKDVRPNHYNFLCLSNESLQNNRFIYISTKLGLEIHII